MAQTLLQRIEAFLAESAIPPSVFGRETVHDPRLVRDLRGGRVVGMRIICRVEHFMNKWRADRRAGRVAPRGDRRLHMVRHPGGKA
ncbi:MAG: hypothetical protein JNL35_16740 [Sphingopyxis sp.]|nr:hypothetical protein [Sphingopyxis sp.]